MAMNTNKVLIGGLVAGIVLNGIDAIANKFILGERMMAETELFKPGLSAGMMTTKSMVAYIIMDFLIGLLLVWTYAAMRPRFGAGPRTAVYSALLFWVLGGIFYSGYFMMGMMSAALWLSFSVLALINLVVAAWVGARVYTEEGAAA